MTANVSPAFITMFASEVHHAYQAESKLRDTVRLKTGVVGSTAKFPKVGKGVATQVTPMTDVVPLNTAFSQGYGDIDQLFRSRIQLDL